MKPLLLLALSLNAALGLLAHPASGIAVDPQGRIFFTDGPRIAMIETNGVARVIVQDPNHEMFYQLHHIQRAPDGGFLTASDMGNSIWRFSTTGAMTRFYPPQNEDRPLRVGRGGDPFAVDPAGNIYAVNSAQNRFTQIVNISPEGLITILAGGKWGFADGTGTAAQFEDLHGGSMLMAPDGAVFLSDSHVRVRRIAPNGRVTTLAGGSEKGHVDGRGREARFDGASGLALDSHRNLFVVEQSGFLRKISTAGIVTTMAGSGKRGGLDGPQLEATFDEPSGIATIPNGDCFILEPHIPRVRKISNGWVTTILKNLR